MKTREMEREGEDEEKESNELRIRTMTKMSFQEGWNHFSDTDFFRLNCRRQGGTENFLPRLETCMYHRPRTSIPEKALIKQHSDEVKRERHQHRAAAQTLRKKHQTNVDSFGKEFHREAKPARRLPSA
jgi:hypothetical protein